jgi:hypothetical protein
LSGKQVVKCGFQTGAFCFAGLLLLVQ